MMHCQMRNMKKVVNAMSETLKIRVREKALNANAGGLQCGNFFSELVPSRELRSRYVPIRMLGKGSFGVVFDVVARDVYEEAVRKARDIPNKRHFALKLVRGSRAEVAKENQTSIDFARKIGSRYVVQPSGDMFTFRVDSGGKQQPRFAIEMPRINGTLESLVDNYSFSSKEDKLVRDSKAARVEDVIEEILQHSNLPYSLRAAKETSLWYRAYVAGHRSHPKALDSFKRLNTFSVNVGSLLWQMIGRMQRADVTHNDMHEGNIAYRFNKKKEMDFMLIDFGFSNLKTNYWMLDATQLIRVLSWRKDKSPLARNLCVFIMQRMRRCPWPVWPPNKRHADMDNARAQKALDGIADQLEKKRYDRAMTLCEEFYDEAFDAGR